MARCPIHPSPTEGFTLRPGQGRQEVWLPWHESGRAERLRNLETAFPNADFPPIAVYELEGSYFVADGHHRVALSRQRGIEVITAEVTRIHTGRFEP
jgi:hypothetical protein